MMAHYIFNLVDDADADGLLRAKVWAIDADEPHRSALGAGDLVLLYLAAPARTFIGHAVLASAAHDWAPAEAAGDPGDAAGGVRVEGGEGGGGGGGGGGCPAGRRGGVGGGLWWRRGPRRYR